MKELDLHGVKHSDVEARVVRFIRETKSIRPALIITGNSIKMKEITVETNTFCYYSLYNEGFIIFGIPHASYTWICGDMDLIHTLSNEK